MAPEGICRRFDKASLARARPRTTRIGRAIQCQCRARIALKPFLRRIRNDHPEEPLADIGPRAENHECGEHENDETVGQNGGGNGGGRGQSPDPYSRQNENQYGEPIEAKQAVGALLGNRGDPQRRQTGAHIYPEEQKERTPDHETLENDRRELGLRAGIGKQGIKAQMRHQPEGHKRQQIEYCRCRHALQPAGCGELLAEGLASCERKATDGGLGSKGGRHRGDEQAEVGPKTSAARGRPVQTVC